MERLIFRAECSPTIGRGHLSRCIAIADMLKDQFHISFVFLKNEKEFALKFLKNYKYILIDDNNDLLVVLNETDIIWIDGYNFTEEWKKEIKSTVSRLIETNDIPYPAENVDVIFNPTPGIIPSQYMNTKAELYLGLDYVLLRQGFLKEATKPIQTPTGTGVFICFGGADTFSLGEKIVDELIKNHFTDPIFWVTTAAKHCEKKLYPKHVHVLSNLSESEMTHYMSVAKAVLIPSSVLSFEAMAIRKPIYTCYFVDNQKLINTGLLKQELAYGVGYLKTKKDVELVISNFLNFYNDDNSHLKQITKQTELLDGKSDKRISEILLKV